MLGAKFWLPLLRGVPPPTRLVYFMGIEVRIELDATKLDDESFLC